jgi:hypothetical protein
MIPSCLSFMAAANRSRPCVSTASDNVTGAALKSSTVSSSLQRRSNKWSSESNGYHVLALDFTVNGTDQLLLEPLMAALWSWLKLILSDSFSAV